MSIYRLKLSGLSDTDKNSVKSMLRLSHSLLSAEWQIVDNGAADLTLFSFETDAGKAAWDKRDTQVSAALSHSTKVEHVVDIIFQKPLRKSSFADNINLAQQKLEALEQYQAAQTSKQQQTTKKPVTTSWLQKWFKKPQPNHDLPELQLAQPDNSGQAKDTIKEKKLLLAWVEQLPEDSSQRVSTLLANLTRLNRLALKPQHHLDLLEIYLNSTQDTLSRRDISSVKRDLNMTHETLKAIRNIHDLLGELVNGYEKIVAHHYYHGERADDNIEMWFAINMAAEAISLTIIHHFQYYRAVSTELWQKLHQYYAYLEACGCVENAIIVKENQLCRSYFDIYVQILLTYLSDPYSLARFEAPRLYQLLAPFVNKTSIYQPLSKEVTSDSSFLLTGLYAVDLASAHAPLPMHSLPGTEREQAGIRTFNIQPLMLSLSQIKKQLDKSHDKALDLEQRLTLKIIPHLDTTAQRRYHRISTGKNRTFTLVKGVKNIHQALSNTTPATSSWTMCNQSSGGMMAQHDSQSCPAINIGDFVGIFESGLNIKLAIISWLHIDPESDTFIGLQHIEGLPTPIFCMPDGEAREYPALSLANQTPGDNPRIFTETGLYSAKRKFRLKNEENEPFMITAVQLHTNTLDYELFSYKVIAGS